MTLPLLLGECPSANGDRYWEFPLSGSPARVICRLAGIEPETSGTTYGRWYWAMRERFDARNVFDRHQRRWSAPAARERGELLRDLVVIERRPRVVVLGRRAGAALGLRHLDWFESDGIYSLLPHPSGLNRLYNDPGLRARAGAILREAMIAVPSAGASIL